MGPQVQRDSLEAQGGGRDRRGRAAFANKAQQEQEAGSATVQAVFAKQTSARYRGVN